MRMRTRWWTKEERQTSRVLDKNEVVDKRRGVAKQGTRTDSDKRRDSNDKNGSRVLEATSTVVRM